jgi:hypothetical protein
VKTQQAGNGLAGSVVICKVWRLAMAITVATRFKAGTVFARSNTGVMDSNPTQGMDVFVALFFLCIVLCAGRGLETC